MQHSLRRGTTPRFRRDLRDHADHWYAPCISDVLILDGVQMMHRVVYVALAAVGYPVIILLLIPLRTLIVPRLPFSAEGLTILDRPRVSIRAWSKPVMPCLVIDCDCGLCSQLLSFSGWLALWEFIESIHVVDFNR